MSPVVSIIIPVHNVENYIRVCLDSVLNQSFTDFEVICIDDCSSDSSYAILKEYEQRDTRIRVFQNEKNIMASGSRNVGLDNATGEYVYFIDSDDYIDRDYLSELVGMARKSGADITTNLNIKTHSNGNTTVYIHPNMPEIPDEGCFLDRKTTIEKAFCVVWMRIFKRAFIEENQIRFKHLYMVEDNVFHYMTSFHASSIYYFNGKQTYHYMIREDSVTGVVKKRNERDLSTMKANELIFDYLSEKGLLEKNDAKLFNTYPFFKVDTKAKYDQYKGYFQKILDFLNNHKDMYNEMDWFFVNSILNSDSLEDYLSRYSANLAMGFVKSKMKKR